MSLGELLAEDFETNGRDPLSPGFWALAVCRFGNWRMSRPRLVRPPLTAAYRFARQAAIALWGIDIPYNSTVGRRLRIDHHGGFFLGALSVGDDVIIRHTATIGLIRRGAHKAPVIGNGVEIGPGACIVGEVTVGDGAFIGPNTVVTQDIPAGAVALGNPGRLVELAKVVGAAGAREAQAPARLSPSSDGRAARSRARRASSDPRPVTSRGSAWRARARRSRGSSAPRSTGSSAAGDPWRARGS